MVSGRWRRTAAQRVVHGTGLVSNLPASGYAPNSPVPRLRRGCGVPCPRGGAQLGRMVTESVRGMAQSGSAPAWERDPRTRSHSPRCDSNDLGRPLTRPHPAESPPFVTRVTECLAARRPEDRDGHRRSRTRSSRPAWAAASPRTQGMTRNRRRRLSASPPGWRCRTPGRR